MGCTLGGTRLWCCLSLATSISGLSTLEVYLDHNVRIIRVIEPCIVLYEQVMELLATFSFFFLEAPCLGSCILLRGTQLCFSLLGISQIYVRESLRTLVTGDRNMDPSHCGPEDSFRIPGKTRTVGSFHDTAPASISCGKLYHINHKGLPLCRLGHKFRKVDLL